MSQIDPELLIAQLGNNDEKLKKEAIFQIGRLNILQAIPKLIDLLKKDENSVVRNSAARTLGKLNDPTQIEITLKALIEALSDTDYYVQSNACWSLGKLRDPRAIPALSKMVDPSKKIYAAAGDGMNGKGSIEKDASDKLREEGVKYSDIILEAVKALGNIKDPDSVDPLVIALNDDADGTVRCKAAISLGKINAPKAIPPLIERLKEEKYWYVRRDIIKALAKLKAEAAIPEIVKKTNDMYQDVRDQALDALLKIGKPARVEILKLLFSHPKNAKIQTFIKKNFTPASMKASLETLISQSSSEQEKQKLQQFLNKFK